MNLKRFLISNRSTKLTWDDVIDIFIVNKVAASKQEENKEFKSIIPLLNINTESDDLVNISSDDAYQIEDEFKSKM